MYDDGVDAAVLSIRNQFLVARPFDISPGRLVTIHFDGGGFDTEFVDSVVVGSLELPVEVLVGR
jgi:hypothetical protein